MAKNKIERIDQEIQRTREKIAEQQEKLKALEAQKTEVHPALQQLLAAQQKAVKQQERLQQTLLERTAWLLLHHLMYCLWTHTDMMRDLQTRSCFISMRQWLPRMQICPLVLVWQKAGRPLRMV